MKKVEMLLLFQVKQWGSNEELGAVLMKSFIFALTKQRSIT